jgi:molybdenum-dependent DNA-binding transcriptional regulator ModE
MGRKRRQGNMTPQKTNNNIIEDLVESKGDESPVTDIRRMIIRMFNELKEGIQKQFNDSQENKDKKLKKTGGGAVSCAPSFALVRFSLSLLGYY